MGLRELNASIYHGIREPKLNLYLHAHSAAMELALNFSLLVSLKSRPCRRLRRRRGLGRLLEDDVLVGVAH